MPVIRASKLAPLNRRRVLSSYCSNIYTENLGKMAHMVEEVRDALLDDPEPQSPNGRPKQWSKFDKLLSSIHPLIVVRGNQIRLSNAQMCVLPVSFPVDLLLP